jgi:uncharacterized protein HemY
MLREKHRIVEELALAYRKLQQLEAERASKEERAVKDANDQSSDILNTVNLFPRHTLPLSLFERLPEEPGHILAVLERLKDLKQQGIISDDELNRLKKRVLDRIDRPKVGAL